MRGGAVYRCSILMEKTLPSLFLPPLFFLIGRVCRTFITYRGQGNLHVFLEIFLALDLTALLALQADEWISHPSPFHKTQRHAQECKTLSSFFVPLPSLPFPFLSYLWQLCWPVVATGLLFAFCMATGTKKRVEVPHVQAEWWRQAGGQACQQWTFPSPRPSLTASLLSPQPTQNREPQLPIIWPPHVFAVHVWLWSLDVFVPLSSSFQVVSQVPLHFSSQTCC